MERVDERFTLSESIDSLSHLDVYQPLEDVESLDDMVDHEDVEVECDLCGTPMEYEYGKYVCPNCGYIKVI